MTTYLILQHDLAWAPGTIDFAAARRYTLEEAQDFRSREDPRCAIFPLGFAIDWYEEVVVARTRRDALLAEAKVVGEVLFAAIRGVEG